MLLTLEVSHNAVEKASHCDGDTVALLNEELMLKLFIDVLRTSPRAKAFIPSSPIVLGISYRLSISMQQLSDCNEFDKQRNPVAVIDSFPVRSSSLQCIADPCVRACSPASLIRQ